MEWKEFGARRMAVGLMLAAVTALAAPPVRALPLAPSPEGDGYVVRFAPADLALEPTPEGTRVTYRDAAAPLEPSGAPGLPVVPVVLEIPADRTAVAVEILEVEDEVVVAGGLDVAPAAPPAHGDRTFPSPARRADLYAAAPDAPWARLAGEGFARGHRLATVELWPVRWDPATGELRLATAIHFRLELAPATDRPLARRRVVPELEERFTATLDRALGRAPSPAAHRAPPRGPTPFAPNFPPSTDGSPVPYVILTSEAMRPAFQLLASWKTQSGLAAAVISIEWVAANYPNGADRAEQVRFFLQDAYQNWGTLWTLLGGDTDVIPVRYAASTLLASPEDPQYIPTDLYYSCLDGNWNADKDDRIGEALVDNTDLVPELYVGRAPVSTYQEALDYVQKTLRYERIPPVDGRYPASICFLAEHLGFTDGALIAQDAYVQVHPWMRRVRMYETYQSFPGAVPLTFQAAIDSVNSGFGWVHHVGHGFRNTMSVANGSLSNADADAFTNGDRQSFVFAINCSSASIDFNSIGERWVKNAHGGAVGYIGTTRLAFAQVSRRYQNEFYRLAFADSVGTAGECLNMSRLRWVMQSDTDNFDRWTQFALILLGEPDLPLWTNRPEPLAAQHPASLTLGTGSFAVNVQAGGSPVDSARVTLWALSQDYKSGYTNPSGQVNLPFDPETTGTFLLTASRRNYLPYEATVPVLASAGPFLYVQGVSIDDDNAGGSVGNGDGLMNAGETPWLTVAVRNSGQTTATGVSASLVAETGAQHVLIFTGARTYADIPPGGVAQGQAHVARVLPSVPPGLLPRFRLDVTTAQGAWSDVFVLPVYTATTEQYGHTWTDPAPGGNGNGVIEPGESIAYAVELRNDGSGQAVAVAARLRVLNAQSGAPDPEVTVTDDFGNFGILDPTERSTGNYAFDLSLLAVPADLRLELTVTDIYDTLAVELSDLQVPGPVDSLRAIGTDDAIRILWGRANVPDLYGYDIYRAPAPAGPFLRVNNFTVIGTTFYEDSRLPTLTRFYYKVAARDSSFNLGAFSGVISASTNPPLAAGWPIETGQTTTSGPQVADFDRDGQNELVMGSDYIYAWHANGTEVRDGDSDPRTSGVFTTAGYDPQNGFRAEPAIFDIDRDGTDEIVMVGWGAGAGVGYLHVLGPDGAARPGWPRSLAVPFNWASPVIGQLDADPQYEIVVQQGQNGVVYAFNHDGTELRDGDNNPSTTGPFFVTGATFAYSSPALGDFDLDGKDEVVVATNNALGNVFLLDGDGTVMPGWPQATGGQITASAAVADLDGVLPPEIVIASEDDSLYVFRANGGRYPGWPLWAWVNTSDARISSPIVVDLDDNGQLDILFVANDGQFHAWTRTGAVVPGWSNVFFALDALDSEVTQSSPTAGDVDGDGRLEVLIGAENGKLYGFNHDGTELNGFPIQLEGEVRSSATIGDFDRDGLAEIGLSGWDQSVYVWDLPGVFVRERVPWPSARHDLRNTGNLATPIFIGVDDGGGPAASPAAAIRLWPARPNPFNPSTEMVLDVPPGSGRAPVTLQIYDLSGRLARVLLAAPLGPGRHAFTWDGRDGEGRRLASGVYFLRAAAPGFEAVRKLTMVK